MIGQNRNMENRGEIVIYQSRDGSTNLEVKLADETIWLTQQQMVELYQSSKANVSEHIKHIFEEEELVQSEVVRKFRTTVIEPLPVQCVYYLHVNQPHWINTHKLRFDSTCAKYAQTTNMQIMHNTIAESRPEEKDVMVKVVVNLINKNNQ